MKKVVFFLALIVFAIYGATSSITVVHTKPPAAFKVTAPAPKTSGLIDLVADLGCDPTGKADCWPAIQACLDGLTSASTTIHVPPGSFLLSRTLVAGQYSPAFKGAGRNLSSLAVPAGSSFPPLAYGIRQSRARARGHGRPSPCHRWRTRFVDARRRDRIQHLRRLVATSRRASRAGRAALHRQRRGCRL